MSEPLNASDIASATTAQKVELIAGPLCGLKIPWPEGAMTWTRKYFDGDGLLLGRAKYRRETAATAIHEP